MDLFNFIHKCLIISASVMKECRKAFSRPLTYVSVPHVPRVTSFTCCWYKFWNTTLFCDCAAEKWYYFCRFRSCGLHYWNSFPLSCHPLFDSSCQYLVKYSSAPRSLVQTKTLKNPRLNKETKKHGRSKQLIWIIKWIFLWGWICS